MGLGRSGIVGRTKSTSRRMPWTIKTEHELTTAFEIWLHGWKIQLSLQQVFNGDKTAQRHSAAHQGRSLMLHERPPGSTASLTCDAAKTPPSL